MIGDPVDVFHGRTFESLKDLSLESSVEPVPFIRYYTSEQTAWDDANYADLDQLPGPFGKHYNDPNSIHWWHNFYSFVTPLFDYNGTPYNQWGVRVQGGALVTFEQCSPAPCWAYPTALNKTTRDSLLYFGESANPVFMLIQGDGHRFLYGGRHVTVSSFRAPTLTRYFLTEIRTGAGQKVASISYASPSGVACPAGDDGSDAGVPYVSHVTTADGNYLAFSYKVLKGKTDCAIDFIASSDGMTQAQYTYQTDPEYPDPGNLEVGLLATVTRQNNVTGAVFTESYLTTLTDDLSRGHFIISGPGGTETTNHAYTGGTGVVVASHALSENLEFDGPARSDELPQDLSVLQPSTPIECSGSDNIRVSTLVTDDNVCPGDGVNACGATPLSRLHAGMTTDFYGEYRPYYDQTPYYDSPPQSYPWMSASMPLTEWACHDTQTLRDHPIGQRDERGGWTNYSYGPPSSSTAADGTPVPDRQTELQTVTRGSSSLGGSDALLAEVRNYTYGADGQQLLALETQVSAIPGAGYATTSYNYEHYLSDPKGSRLKSVIRCGSTDTTLSGLPPSRCVGTFYFTNHQCLGDGADSLRRTLEVHGPCLVANSASSDCNGLGTVPITQYLYYGVTTGNESGKLSAVRAFTSGTTSNCTSAAYLETSYLAYDALGHPTSVQDPDGQVTTLTWGGERPLTMTRSGASWQFQYDHDKLTLVRFPELNYEIFCYRVGATGACSGGVWSDKMQWRAKYDSALSTSSERVDYVYWPDGTIQTESYSDTTGSRRVLHHGANPVRQPTYFKVGEDTSASMYRLVRQFNGAGDLTAVGFPFNDPPDFCGSLGSVSPYCAATNVDRLGRLASLDQTPDPTNAPGTVYETRVSYDAQGNVSSIVPNCGTTGACSSPGATYQYDDFGNLVKVTAPWLDNGSGASGTTYLEYDASGHVVKRQTPEMANANEYLSSTFDMRGRQTSVSVQVVGGSNTNLYTFAYDTGSAPDASCDQPANTAGRLLKRSDSFGDTWYRYDAFGRIQEEIRLRTGVAACSSAAPQDIQNTHYTWSVNGTLTSITYPFGRTVTYTYGSGAAIDRPAAISFSQFDGASWSAGQGVPLISGIVWEPYGGLRAYIIDDQTACAPTYVNYRHVKPGGSTDVHTGLVGSLTVSTTATGFDIYRRDYTWQADQVTQTDTYLLGATTARSETYGYDALQRLTGMAGTNFSTVGGAVGSRVYGYDGRGNRTSQINEDCGYALTYGSPTHPDQLTQRASSCSGSILSTSYHYDRDGRVDSMTWPNDSTGTPSYQFTMGEGPDGLSSAVDSVYKSINVNGVVYGYFYDAFHRRRAKQYPLGMEDEFYYRLDNLLLVDVGNDSTISVGAHPVDEYVWLGGRPVAVIRSKLDTSYARQPDSNTADCTRSGAYQSCGTFAIVTDHIGAPVLMLDDQQRVVGEFSMDPLGAVNTVSLNKETAHPYANDTDVTLADFKQPGWGTGITTRLRVNFALVDTEANNGTPLDYVTLKDGDTGVPFAPGIGGHNDGRVTSQWVIPTAGHVQAVFSSNGTNCCPLQGGTLDCGCAEAPNFAYTGVAMESYEFQRYDWSASPSTIPLRYAGQYMDSETKLLQNWNRFYDSSTGRYLEHENALDRPRVAVAVARHGILLPVYSYASNNPIYWTDPKGLDIVRWPNLPLTPEQRDYIDSLESNPRIGEYVSQLEMDHSIMVRLIEIPGAQVNNKGDLGETKLHPATSGACTGSHPAWADMEYAAEDALATLAHEMGHAWNDYYAHPEDAWQSNFTAQWFENAITGSDRWFHNPNGTMVP